MKNILAGFFIGVGAILPGISSGVFCVAFGIYEKLIDSILHFFKNIKENFIFLSLTTIGVLFGILIFGNILKFLYSKFYIETCFCFMGFILGSIPLIFKQANVNKFSISHILCFLFSFILSIYLMVLERNQSIAIFNVTSSNYNYLILVGIIMAAGIVVPGISKTVILMLFGIYEIYLNAITTLNLSILVPLFAGTSIRCFNISSIY